MRSLPEIKAMNAAVVDRNVSVHLRARQADIYEKALRKVLRTADALHAIDHLDHLRSEFARAFQITARNALKRAARVK